MQVGFFGILGLIFITLKLLNIVAWSWWIVLAPIYVPTALWLLLAGFALLLAYILHRWG